jgi:hypothetical protein
MEWYSNNLDPWVGHDYEEEHQQQQQAPRCCQMVYFAVGIMVLMAVLFVMLVVIWT